MYILLCGLPPFNGKTDKDIMNAVLRGKFPFSGDTWAHISKEAKDLISKMLTYNPKDIISALEAYNHLWLLSYLDNDKVLKSTVAMASLPHLKKFNAGEKLK